MLTLFKGLVKQENLSKSTIAKNENFVFNVPDPLHLLPQMLNFICR